MGKVGVFRSGITLRHGSFEGAESAGAGRDYLDLRVEALNYVFGDSVGEVVKHTWEMVLQHQRDLHDRSQRGFLGFLQLLVEEGVGRGLGSQSPEASEGLAQTPRIGDFQIVAAEFLKALLFIGFPVGGVLQEELLAAGQPLP